MDCALWLNRHKIYSADEIPDNFDIASIRGYYLGGSLIKWLDSHGGSRFARKLEKLSPDMPDLNGKLCEIFGQNLLTKKPHSHNNSIIAKIDGEALANRCSSGAGFSFGSLSGSNLWNFANSFALGGSFYGSYKRSYSFLWEWEWEWFFRNYYGSFSGSFGSYFGFYGSRSLYSGSGLAFGSFYFGSFGNINLGSFPYFDAYGSFPVLTADEYYEIMFRCLNICPLDRFGYGIHLI